MRPTQHQTERRLSFERLEERRVLATLIVTLNTDALDPIEDGQLTFREAIKYVNRTSVPAPDEYARIDETTNPLGVNDEIVFNLPTLNVPVNERHKVFLTSALPLITAQNLKIDGTNTNQGENGTEVSLVRANTTFDVFLNYNGIAPCASVGLPGRRH